MALGVLRAMHEAGREIPSEVSIVGFDDIPEAPYFTPPLTTVRQDFNEVGTPQRALLLATMEAASGSNPARRSDPELIVRASTARAAPRRRRARTPD